MSWWDDLPPELRPPTSGGGDARAEVLKAFAAKGIQPRDEADVQYWIDFAGRAGGINSPYVQGRMAQAQGGVGDYTEGRGGGGGGMLNSISGGGGGGAPATYNYHTALDRLQQATGRTLSSQDIQGLFQRFGGNEQSTFTDEGLAPVIAYLRQGGQETGQGTGQGTGVPGPMPQAPPAPPIPSAPDVLPPPTPPTVPAYERYRPGPAPTPERFTAPTAEEARQTPGYQFAVDQANQALQRSAAARGGLLSGGALKEIGAYNIGMADTNYQNVFGNRLAGTQTNNANALNAYNATTGANLAAGGLNLQGENQQFQNTYGPQWAGYLSRVGQGQFGANYGLAANAQGFGQGLATNTFNLGAQNQRFQQGLSNRLFELGAQGQYFNQGLAGRQFDLQRGYFDLFAQNQGFNQGFQTQGQAWNQWNTMSEQDRAFWLAQVRQGNPGSPYPGTQ